MPVRLASSAALLIGLLAAPALADRLPPGLERADVQWHAEFQTRGGEVVFSRARSRLLVTPATPESFRVELDVQWTSGKGRTEIVLLSEPRPRGFEGAVWRASIQRSADQPHARFVFTALAQDSGGKWKPDREGRRSLDVGPPAGSKRFWKLAVERTPREVRVLFDGQTVLVKPVDTTPGALAIDFGQGDRIRGLHVLPVHASAFVPLELGALARPVGKKQRAEELVIDGVPFRLEEGGSKAFDLRRAQWPDWKKDPGATVEAYDLFPPHGDPRRPMLSAPSGDYVAAHVLATGATDPRSFSGFSLTFGAFGTGLVRQHVVHASVPRSSELVHVRVPMGVPLTQEIPGAVQLALSKQVRLAVRQSDPSRFRYRPLGHQSGVRIYAVTLERSPVRLSVTCDEPGHAFPDTKIPWFRVKLDNDSAVTQRFRLDTVATHIDGQRMFQAISGSLAAGASQEVRLVLPVVRRGYYDLRIRLENERGDVLLTKHTSFALLRGGTRSARSTSPFGTWDFSGAHHTSRDAKLVGALYDKLGFRYGMFRFTPEERARWGVVQGREPVTLGSMDAYTTFREKNPDAPAVALLMHEHGLSERHLLRVPDLFDGRASYALDQAEEARLRKLMEDSAAAARAFREHAPDVHLRLGNGTLPVKEEFYRRRFPAELFDSAGNEAACFGRPPEAQPPDPVALNASLWMDRRLLDHYGYGNKPVSACFETCFPATNPGNLPLRTQAEYLARHALHALAWRLPSIRLGMIMDAGNSYYFSNWGASGLCTALPDVRAKPAFVALATLTSVLDGASFRDVMELGSPSAYGLAFDLPDRRAAYALWTVRGRRPVTLELADGSDPTWTLTESQGHDMAVSAQDGRLTLELGPAPVFLTGRGRVARATLGRADHRDGEPGVPITPVSALDTLKDWEVEANRDWVLEFHNSLTPRIQGDFSFDVAEHVEGRERVLAVTPRAVTGGAETTPMYGALRHRRGLTLPGKPTSIGLWVNGNSSFGRVIYELEDAGGERWISIGSNSRLGLPAPLLELVPRGVGSRIRLAEWNSDDVFGLSRFDFDGWRYVSFPLPGNYPGEGYGWPANSQWLHDRDGRVAYPLKLRRLIIELPRKTLHVRTFAPTPRATVYLSQLVVEHGDTEHLAPAPDEEGRHRAPLQ